jgi:hypothetical protein
VANTRVSGSLWTIENDSSVVRLSESGNFYYAKDVTF